MTIDRRGFGVIVALALAIITTSSPQIAWASDRFAISASGTEVSDMTTGLVWRRCSVGQTYVNGSCAGSATLFTHQQALEYARSELGWRVPNVKELTSIVDGGRTHPNIDLAVFPGTPNSYFWSSTPVAGDSSQAWAVRYFALGEFIGAARTGKGLIRLVKD